MQIRGMFENIYLFFPHSVMTARGAEKISEILFIFRDRGRLFLNVTVNLQVCPG